MKIIRVLGSSSPSKEVPELFERIHRCSVKAANTLVPPPDGKQWLCGLAEGQPLFVRDCYSWFYEEAVRKMSTKEPKCPGLIYTGNPGIGKSSWLNYALVRFLQDDYAVVLERAKTGDFFVFENGECSHQEKKIRGSVLEKLPEKSVYLFDPDENESHPLESNVFTIVASSPQEKHYKALRKLQNSSIRYFPCWSLAELQGSAPSIDQGKVEERWLKWGGIPRYVFDDDQRKLLGTLKEIVDHVDLELVEKSRFTAEIPEHQQQSLSHMMVHYVVTVPYEEGALDFASEWIGQQVVEASARRDYRKLIEHYERTRLQEWQGAYCGHLWEHLCHSIIPLGTKKELKLEPLTQGLKGRRILEKAVTVEKGNMADMMSVLGRGCYFQPLASNFPVIDAAVMVGNDVFGFQMTVDSSHSPKAHETIKLLDAMPDGKKFHLVWVVDPARSDRIKKAQSFQQSKSASEKASVTQMSKLEAIPQWLLELKFPKESPFLKK